MLLSIIIPIYNSEKYLSDCLNSLLDKTNDLYEVLLIDDGSTDQSLCICESFVKIFRNVRLIRKENGGVSSARNVGLEIAKGKYVTFIDSDDRVASNYISEVLSIISCGDYDCVCYNYTKVFNQKNEDVKPIEVGGGPYVFNDVKENIFLRKLIGPYSDYELRHIELLDSFSVCWNKVYKREKLISIFFEDIKKYGTSEDLVFNCEFFRQCRSVYYIDKPLYLYSKYNAFSITSSSRCNLWKKWLVLYNTLSLFVEGNPVFKQAFQNRVGYGLLSLFLSCSNGKSTFQLAKIIKEAMKEDLYYSSLSVLKLKPLPFKYRLFFWFLRQKMYFLSAYIINYGRRIRSRRLK